VPPAYTPASPATVGGPRPAAPPAAVAAPAYAPAPATVNAPTPAAAPAYAPAPVTAPAGVPVSPPSAAGAQALQPANAPPPTAANGTVQPAPAVYPPQPGTAAATAAPEEPPREKRRCAAGEFCFGPVLTGGALNVFGIGVQARMQYWGFAFDYQFISLGYKDVDGDLSLITIEGRVYPFGNAFFLSAGFAWQNIALHTIVHASVQGVPIDVDAKGSVNLPLFKLGLGFGGRDGFVFGIDLGFGFRLHDADVKLQTNLPQFPEVIKAEGEFRQAANKWVEWLPFTPQLNVLRLSYLF
jgi:hypothetical protein